MAFGTAIGAELKDQWKIRAGYQLRVFLDHSYRKGLLRSLIEGPQPFFFKKNPPISRRKFVRSQDSKIVCVHFPCHGDFKYKFQSAHGSGSGSGSVTEMIRSRYRRVISVRCPTQFGKATYRVIHRCYTSDLAISLRAVGSLVLGHVTTGTNDGYNSLRTRCTYDSLIQPSHRDQSSTLIVHKFGNSYQRNIVARK